MLKNIVIQLAYRLSIVLGRDLRDRLFYGETEDEAIDIATNPAPFGHYSDQELDADLAAHAAEEQARMQAWDEDDYDRDEKERRREYEEECEEADLREAQFLASEDAPDDRWRYDHMGDGPL